MADNLAKPRRRFLRFSLRTLFVVVTVFAIGLAFAGPHPAALNFAVLMLLANFVVFHREMWGPRRLRPRCPPAATRSAVTGGK